MNRDLEALLVEYRQAQAFSMSLLDGLDEEQVAWRPHADSSAIGWHLGHQAAVNHYLVRNLTAAEPSINAEFDRLFDSATAEPDRGILPALPRIIDYRETVAACTARIMDRIGSGAVAAPHHLPVVATGLMVAVINHEYQHDAWIIERRHDLGLIDDPAPTTDRCEIIDGYVVLTGSS